MRDSLGSMAISPPVASGFLAAIVEGDIDSLLALADPGNRASASAAHRRAEAFHGLEGIRHFLAVLEQRAPEMASRS